MKKNKMDLKNKLRNLGIGLMSVGAIGCNDYKPQEVNTENWKCKAQIVLPITKAEVGSGDSWARYRDRSFGYFRTTSYVSANSETPDEICSYPPSEAEIGGQIFYDLNNEGEVLSGEETNRKFFHPGRILTGITRPPYAPSNDLGSVTFESEPFDAMLSNGCFIINSYDSFIIFTIKCS